MKAASKIIAIAGNPNVGKSTLFNHLTGLHQHTGNWPGKTVCLANGSCRGKHNSYELVDLPGTYSLLAHSAEEECARDFLCFAESDAVIVVCDASCLERNLNLVLQTLEISKNVIICVNLLDEAKRKGITIHSSLLSEKLGVPVVGTVAHKKKSLSDLLNCLDSHTENTIRTEAFSVQYGKPIEDAIAILEPVLAQELKGSIPLRWLSLRLLDEDDSLLQNIELFYHQKLLDNEHIRNAYLKAKHILSENGLIGQGLKDHIVSCLVKASEKICEGIVVYGKSRYYETDRKLDRFFTGRWSAYPFMLLLLVFIFWLSISGANYPSRLLSSLLFWIQDRLTDFFHAVHAPDWLHGALVLGAYRVPAWVVSVMLPPMAIFFPLFTLLEDSGYLPRIAYNLDKPFERCHACGKQALTMCMGFGCNAAGVVGCRIIDSPRERLIAILTNSFVPCNGRFPALIAIITMFFVGTSGGMVNSLLSALFLTIFIVLGVVMTLVLSKILSLTLLKGVPSSFTLELPPYRRPQIGKVIIRSLFDRTLFVLGRAVIVAVPAGLLIWIMANFTVDGTSLLTHCADFLNPFARLLGLDGIILMAFILGLPANEIVIPIIIMAYLAQGSLQEFTSLAELKQLLVAHGWTWITAVSTMLFSLMHWPCSTTLLTIKKETHSLKWMILAFLLPTITGILFCMIFANTAKLFSMAW